MSIFNNIFQDFSVKLLGTFLVCILYVSSRIIYNLYFHPLAAFKGPKLWSATRLRYIISLWSGKLHSDVRTLHQQYGDVVRIAPDEISFARPDAWKDIYSNAPGRPAFPRSELWHGRTSGRPMSIVNAFDPKEHSRFRKAMEPGFTEKALRLQEPIIQEQVDKFIKALDKLASSEKEGAVTDIVRWLGFVTFDMIGDLGFGESFGCLERSEYHPWVSLIFNSLRAATYLASLRYYPSINWLLGLAIPKSVMKKEKEHWQLAVDKVNRRLGIEQQRQDIIGMIQQDENGIHGLTVPEMQATASLIILAGSETSVSVLTGTTNYLIRNPAKLTKLVEEIRSRFTKEEDMTLTALKELIYLNAVLQEGLRLCNPTPIGLPRIAPPGGGIVCGYHLPGNTFVNVHPHTLSRSSSMFHNPEGFHPERWLPTSKNENSPFSNDVKNAVQAFSLGPRSCIGRPLAWAELRLILARMVWRFDLGFVNSDAGRVKWEEQRSFTVVERRPFEVRVKRRVGLDSVG